MEYEQMTLELEVSKISDNYVVTKSNTLIDTQSNLNLQEQRVILALISLIQPDDKDFKTHYLKVKDLADMLDIQEKNFYKKVKEVILSLQRKEIVIREKETNSDLHVHWLSASRYYHRKGLVELEFSPQLRPYLLQLRKEYTKYKLWNVLQLRSKYSIRMFELLKRFQSLGKRNFSVDELRYKLEVEDGKYEQYGHFKSRILKKAQDEISKKTDISFTFEEHKKGAKVEGLTFHIHSKENVGKLISDNEPVVLKDDSYELLIRFGIKSEKAKKLIEQFGEERVKENLTYVFDKKQNDDVNNISGYIIKAVQENYAGHPTVVYNEEDELNPLTSIQEMNRKIKQFIFFHGKI
uniref:replication initiation protein n=1 Tax=Aneurinibacillus tyrosinisolvens TaxID=1443435 RepID=UPI00069C4A6F